MVEERQKGCFGVEKTPPPKPPRKSCSTKPTTTDVHEGLQSVYEDLDAFQSAVTDGNQPEVIVRPVPPSRSRLVSKPEALNPRNNHADAADADHSSSSADSHAYAYPTLDFGRPWPVRPPPIPPMSRPGAADKPKSETNLCDSERSGSSSIVGRDVADKPAVLPRREHSSQSRRASANAVSPAQMRPRPPTPPPYGGQAAYSEVQYRTYLHILPDNSDHVTTNGRSEPRLGQNPRESSQNKTTSITEEINMMLRWLKRVSKSDSLAPPLYGLSIEDEIRSFQQKAEDLRKALRLYNLLMMKRNESLRDLLAEFGSISSSLDKMQKKSKTMSIAGGTTGAVGGVAAVLGVAFAPCTMGASLIATAVGAGMVASAGGLGAHTVKRVKKKNVTRTAVEKLVDDYTSNIVDVEHCLDFILSAMSELRRHDLPRLQRAGVQTDSLKMAHLSQSVMSSRNSVGKGSASGMSSERLLRVFAKELDQYFTEKHGQKLKKSCKSRFSGRVCLLGQNLQDELDHLTCMWEMFS